MIVAEKKVKTDTDVLFEINGFEVKRGHIYLVGDKLDKTAPSGMRDKRMTKFPQAGVEEIFHVGCMQIGTSGAVVWDTGFYPESYCFKNESDPKNRQKLAKSRFDNVLKPYRAATANSKAFEHEDNDKFFDQTRFKVYTDLLLNADDPIQLMTLYFALMTKYVCPDEKQGDPAYVSTSYVIKDVAKNSKDRNEKASLQFEVIGAVSTLLTTDEAKLRSILNWLDMPVTETASKDTLIGIVMQYIEGSSEKPQTLLKLISDADTQVGLDKFNIYKKLKEVHRKSGKITKSSSGMLSYNGIEIGADFKGASDNIAKDSILSDIKKELLIS